MNVGRLAENFLPPRATEAPPELGPTQERIVPGKTHEALFREHEERYAFAGRYVCGKDVLDVACGTGVGTSFLRQAGARHVWGLDLDPGAIAFAKAKYGDCEFAQGNATDLFLPDSSVDVVVSFETLEHLEEGDQRKFLRECRRVLRPGGTLICSTPNTTLYRWYGKNPFHRREYTTHEFASLLAAYFVGLALFYQSEKIFPLVVVRRLSVRSLELLRLKEPVKTILGMQRRPLQMRREFSRGGESTIREIPRYQSTWLRQPTFVVAVCRKTLE